MAFISDLAGDDRRNMPHVDDSVRQQLIGFESLPSYLSVINSAYPQQAQAELAAQRSVTPGYNQLALDTLAAYGIPLTQLGNQINAVQATGDIQTDINTLKTLEDSGGLDIARRLDASADPLYNASRTGLYKQLDDYMTSLSPRLTGSETEQMARGINATGGLGVNSASRNLQNAAVFGSAGQQKLNQFGQGIANAANIMQNTKLPTGTFTTAFGKTRSNLGQSQFQGIPQLSNTANAFGSQFLGDVRNYVDAMNQYKAGRKPTGDKVAQDVNTAASVTGSFMGKP